jgi:hypothetical protein
VAKIFLRELFILAKGPSSVNGKSVPFAQFRKGSGYPEQRTCHNNLFLPSYAFISFIKMALAGDGTEGYLAFQMHMSY